MAHEKNPARSVTLTTVAKDAGVAPMTVSRYLNQHPNITEKTAKKIASAIKRLGYTPNVAARILMGQPSNTIGLIVPTLADTFFSEIAHNVQATARESSKLVWVAASDGNMDREVSILEQMRQHHVDGILLIPAPQRPEGSGLIRNVPLVAIDRPVEADSDSVLVDNRGGAARMVEHLVGHGYRRILCLSIDAPSVYTIGERIAGYMDVMRRHKLKAAVHSSLRNRETFASEVRNAMRSSRPPQAIFCTNNIATIFLLEVIFEDGLNMPGDVAVGGFDDFELAALMRPGVTVIRQPAGELGRQATRLLMERLISPGTRPKGLTTTLPTSLIVRGSCGCTPQDFTLVPPADTDVSA